MKKLIKYLESQAEVAPRGERQQFHLWINTLKKIMQSDSGIPVNDDSISTTRKGSGVLTVYRMTKLRPSGVFTEYWSTRDQHFLIDLFGEIEAFNLACACAYKRDGQLRVKENADIPAKPNVPFVILKGTHQETHS